VLKAAMGGSGALSSASPRAQPPLPDAAEEQGKDAVLGASVRWARRASVLRGPSPCLPAPQQIGRPLSPLTVGSSVTEDRRGGRDDEAVGSGGDPSLLRARTRGTPKFYWGLEGKDP